MRNTTTSNIEGRSSTLTDDQSRFLDHLRLLGVYGVPWEEFFGTCDILACNRREIGQLLVMPKKLEYRAGKILHPDFINKSDH